MSLVIIIDLTILITLVAIGLSKGSEAMLPFVAFVIVLMPLECVIKLPGLFDLTVARLSLVTLVAIYVIVNKKSQIRTVPLKYLVLLSAGWTLISSVNSVVPLVSVKQCLMQVVEYYVLYYVVAKSVTEGRTVRNILCAMVAAISLCCVFGLCESYFGWSILKFFPQEGWVYTTASGPLVVDDRGIRIRATFPHGILFGAGIAMVVPLALYLLIQTKDVVRKVSLWVGIVLMFWAIYKTGSRGAWLMLALSCLLLSVVWHKKVRKPLLIIGTLCAAVLIIRPGVWDSLANYYASTYDPETPMGSSYNFRYALLDSVTGALARDPSRAIWGYGLGAFRQLGLVVKGPGIPEHRWFTCDSSWILFLYETGYVGFVITATLLLAPIRIAYKNARRLPRPAKDLSLVLLVDLLAFCFMMSSVALYAWGQNGYMFWLLVAASVAHGKLRGQYRAEGSGQSGAVRLEDLSPPQVVTDAAQTAYA